MKDRIYTWNYVYHPVYTDFCLEDERNHIIKLMKNGFDLPEGYIRIPVRAKDSRSAHLKRDRLLKILYDVTGVKHFVVPI